MFLFNFEVPYYIYCIILLDKHSRFEKNTLFAFCRDGQIKVMRTPLHTHLFKQRLLLSHHYGHSSIQQMINFTMYKLSLEKLMGMTYSWSCVLTKLPRWHICTLCNEFLTDATMAWTCWHLYLFYLSSVEFINMERKISL